MRENDQMSLAKKLSNDENFLREKIEIGGVDLLEKEVGEFFSLISESVTDILRENAFECMEKFFEECPNGTLKEFRLFMRSEFGLNGNEDFLVNNLETKSEQEIFSMYLNNFEKDLASFKKDLQSLFVSIVISGAMFLNSFDENNVKKYVSGGVFALCVIAVLSSFVSNHVKNKLNMKKIKTLKELIDAGLVRKQPVIRL